MSSLKLMMNLGKNTVNDYALPVRKTLEKTKTYEIRTYETNKYAVIRYKSVETSGKKSKSESKQGNDEVMKYIWKLMEYTQGSNDKNLNMKFLMPIFVGAETLEENYEGKADAKLVEVTIFFSLPAEYQTGEPPKPIEDSIKFEIIEGFKCYVGTFGGFASDDKFKEETEKLKKELSAYKYKNGKVICISYDPPFKLIGRTNEVLVIADE